MQRRRLGFWRRFAVATVKPPLIALTRRDWRGMEHIPRTGGAIIVVNHLSEADPLTVAHFVYDAGRWPQFLAKSSLFHIPALGPFLRAVRQIPVYRGTVDAARAVEAAIVAVNSGEAVIVYPEGTTPKQGDLTPRRGKTGAARLWLATGAPVVPVVCCGAQDIFDPRSRRLRVRPNIPVTVVAGPPIDLSEFAGVTTGNATLQGITEKIMSVLRTMLAEIRTDLPAVGGTESAAAGTETVVGGTGTAAGGTGTVVGGTGTGGGGRAIPEPPTKPADGPAQVRTGTDTAPDGDR